MTGADGPGPAEVAGRLAAEPRVRADGPLVSCVLVTGHDLYAARRGARWFADQAYPSRELVVVAPSWTGPVSRLPEQLHELAARIVVAPAGSSAAALRDLGCEAAEGELIALWEGDAWYPGWRLGYQVEALLSSGLPLSAASSSVRWDPAADVTWAGDADPWSPTPRVFGASVALPSAAWRRRPFAGRGGRVHTDGSFLVEVEPGELHVPRGVHPWVVVRSGSAGPEAGPTCYPRGTAARLLGPAVRAWGVRYTADRPEPPRTPAAATDQVPRPEPVTVPATPTAPPPEPALPTAPALLGGLAPLVSCIMPTFDRRRFIRQAVRYLERQSYSRLELVVVDDGAEPVADLLDGLPRVRYVRLGERTTTGQKRNLACEAATGDIVLQWDDDDWYGPERVSRQVAGIVTGAVDVTGIGINLLLDVDTLALWATREVEAAEPEFATVESMAGGTLAYAKEWWTRAGGYPDASLGEDVGLLQRFVDAGARVAAVSNRGCYVYVRHGRNSWRFDYDPETGPPGWAPAGAGPLPEDDLAFYAALSAGSVADAR